MKNQNKINFLNILLVLIALVMIYLGIDNGILPPVLTGVGFILIAATTNILKKKF